MIEVIGDQVVPNTVDNQPLAGTEALARVMGLASVTADFSGSGIVRFVAGNHASFLTPEASPEAFNEMQTETATFAAQNGTLIDIVDPSVILPADQ